jgi:hypothetical protein
MTDPVIVEHECTKLVSGFLYFADNGKFDSLAELFTSDCEFDRFGEKLVGPQQIAKVMADARPDGVVSRHGILNVHFTQIAETEAKATVYVATVYGMGELSEGPLQQAPGSPRIVQFDDTYRFDAGEWRIYRRVGQVVLVNG